MSQTAATLTWEAVEHAGSYAYSVDEGDEQVIAEPSLTLSDLKPATVYTVRVKSLAADAGYSDSKWASVEVKTLEEDPGRPTGYTVYPMDPIVVSNQYNLLNAYIRAISDSGEYAVGVDNTLGDPTSFVWEKSTGKYTVLDPGEHDGCSAYDVNDDGIIVGSVSGSDYEKPAWLDFKNGGTWQLLPDNGMSKSFYPSFAVGIANDGTIGGQVLTKLPDGSERCVPCVWKNKQLDQSQFEIPQSGDDLMYGCFLYGMSDDGRVLAGWQDWGVGARSPAVWVDGKMTRIYGESGENVDWVFEGVAVSVSPDGRYVTGYWMPEDAGSVVGFVYDVTTGEKTEINNQGVTVTDAGRVYSVGYSGFGGYIWENGQDRPLESLFEGLDGKFASEVSPEVGSDGMLESCYAVSRDEKVLGGCFVYSAFGTALQYPSIVVFE